MFHSNYTTVTSTRRHPPLVSVLIRSCESISSPPSAYYPSLLLFFFSYFIFWFLCLPLEESFNTFCGAGEQNKSSLIVAQRYTHSTLGENAKTSGSTEEQQPNKKKKRFVCVNIRAQQERRVQRGGGIKNKTSLFSTSEHCIHCCTC